MVSFSLCWGKDNCGRDEKGAPVQVWGMNHPPVKHASPLRKQAALVAARSARCDMETEFCSGPCVPVRHPNPLRKQAALVLVSLLAVEWRRSFEVVHLCVFLARREEQRGVGS